MRGDQLARERWANRAIEASPNGLSVAEVARRGGAQGATQMRIPSEAYSKAGVGFFVFWGSMPTDFDIFENRHK